MNKILIFIVLTLFAFEVKGQFPFEKYPAVKYIDYSSWTLTFSDSNRQFFELIIPDFFYNHDSLKLIMTKFKSEDISDSNVVYLQHDLDTICILYFRSIDSIMADPVRVADFNGDKRKDLKFLFRGWGCGAFNLYLGVDYFFQDSTIGHFTEIFYKDMMFDKNNRLEVDIDYDGNYEIVTQWFDSYGAHNYWTFNIFKYKDGNLVNVNYLDNYPIMIQLLNKENVKITNNISREKMKKYSKNLPDDYYKKYWW